MSRALVPDGSAPTTTSRDDQVSREELEGVRMAGTHHEEVAVIDRGNGGDAQSLGHRNDARVNEAEHEIRVAENQLGGASPVIRPELDEFEIACRNRSNKR